MFILILFFLTLSGCAEKTPEPASRWQKISTRDHEKTTLYQMKVPFDWVRLQTDEALIDTRTPLCTYLIDQEIRLTIHNFPGLEGIPPRAQISRWERQFASLDMPTVSITAQAFSGFVGLLFEGTGLLNEKETTVIGWALQLAPQHRSSLSNASQYHPHMQADLTFKVVGPPEKISQHKNIIINTLRTFSLIEEIPQHL